MGNDKSLENLKSFAPGQTGNPAGRPKGSKNGLRSCLIALLKKHAPPAVVEKVLRKLPGYKAGDKTTFSEALALQLVGVALTGDVAAMKEIAAQTEVPMKQLLEHTGEDGGPVQIVVKPASQARVESRLADPPEEDPHDNA